MPGINLMPSELKPKGSILKLSQMMKKFVLVGFVILLSSAIILIGAILIISGKLKASLSKQETLKSQIKAYQNTEQNLLLTRDRLTKINQIYSFEDSNEEADILDDVLRELPEGVVLKEAELSPYAAKVTIIFTSSLPLTRFIEKLQVQDYQMVELEEFAYNQLTGYEAKLSLVK